jgi:hypothetical protein
VAPSPQLRVLIADDNGLFARALEALLDVERSIDVVGRMLEELVEAIFSAVEGA